MTRNASVGPGPRHLALFVVAAALTTVGAVTRSARPAADTTTDPARPVAGALANPARSASRPLDPPVPLSTPRPAHHWVGTWAASPQDPARVWAQPAVFGDQTLRQIVHISTGGDTLRVRFSNELGRQPLVIGAARIALSAGGVAIVPETSRPLTFGGKPSITVPAGAPAVSDPVALHAPPLADLAISLYLPDSTRATTFHPLASQTTYVSTEGDETAAVTMPTAETAAHWFFLTGVSVRAPEGTGAIVAFGNSITDGAASTVDANTRWPDFLARRLETGRGGGRLAVLNEGISGNRLLHDSAGTGALARFDRDVLRQPGARYVIVLLGINDIGFSATPGFRNEDVSAEQIIAAHRQLIARAHELGLTIYGGTLTPFQGADYFTPAGEAKRQAVNHWIRTSGAYDGVIDFDRALRDPDHPARFASAYDSGDHLHPGDAGYRAMARAVDPRLFGVTRSNGPGTGIRPRAPGCTAFVLRSGEHILVGKNLDWPVGTGVVLANPRGLHKTAWVTGPDRPMRWVARFASVTFNQFGRDFPLGGMNEAGLVVEELSYWPARYPEPDRRPVLDELQWIQYQLDRHATVAEVVSDSAVRISPFRFGLHYLVADAEGRAAVIEFLEGHRVVYVGPDLPVAVLANDTYRNSIRSLRNQVGFGGERVPGNGPESPERFARAAIRLHRLESAGPQAGVADSAFALLENVEQEDTQWSIVYDPPNRTIRYRTRRNPQIRLLRLDDLNRDCATIARGRLIDRSTDGPGAWGPWSQERNHRLIADVWRALAAAGDVEIPPDSVRAAMATHPWEATCRTGP